MVGTKADAKPSTQEYAKKGEEQEDVRAEAGAPSHAAAGPWPAYSILVSVQCSALLLPVFEGIVC